MEVPTLCTFTRRGAFLVCTRCRREVRTTHPPRRAFYRCNRLDEVAVNSVGLALATVPVGERYAALLQRSTLELAKQWEAVGDASCACSDDDAWLQFIAAHFADTN